ncbi:protein sidekick-1-like isoform X2 [Branchiostoma floridae x Branchiostoma japonicum]
MQTGSTHSWFHLLSCLLVAATCTAAQSGGCSLYEDRHGRVQPVDPIAVLGSTVTFNCTIRPEEDGVTAGRVYWRHETETIAVEKYRALSDTISQLVLENVSPESAGRYECYVPEPTNRACGPLVGGVKLNTGYAPEEPVLDRCLSENLDLFTCWWYKGRDTLIKTEYSIVYKHYADQEDQECPRLVVDGDYVVCHFGPGTSHVGNLHFRLNITAQNQLGRAESVNLVNPINYVKPAPVRNLRVIGRRSTSVSLSWSNPASLSHFALLYQAWYRSEWDSTVKYVNLSQTTHGDLTDLSPFTTYDICVRAHPVQLDTSTGDIIGTEGYWSDCPEQLISVQTHKAPPVGTVPAWLHVTPNSHPGIRNVIVYWKELPQRDQNGVIKDYTVAVASRAENGHITQESYRLLTVSGDKRHVNLTSALQLKSDTSYVIKVYASNELGRSQDTVLQLPQDGEVPTIQVSTINVNVTSPMSVTLSWQQPEETRVQLTGYIIFWMAWKSENGMYTWGEPDWQSVVDDQVLTRTMVQHEVSRGLEGRTRYRFGIVIISREGFGETTVIDAYTEEMAPRGQVEDLHLSTSGPTSLQLTWEPLPLEWRGGILQGYRVQYCPLVEGIGTACAEGSTKTVNITGEETASLILRGLSPFTRYTVRIAAVNRQGLGQFSEASVQITAESAPEDPPTDVRFSQVTARVLQLTWDPPRTPNGIITYYMAEVNSDVHQLVDVDTIPVYGNTNYTLRLQACTTAGCGPFSSSHSVTTPIGSPEAPPLPIVSEFKSSPSTVHLRPVTPAHANGPIDHYLVSYRQKDDQGRSQPLVQRVEGTAEAVVEVDCTENKAVLYEFWVQAVNRDEEGKLLPGDPSERLERQMCLGIPVAIVIPVVAGIISIILVTSLVWKNRHRVKRKLFPKVPGPVLFLEEDGPYSALYVVTATNKHEPETCDDISDFLREGGEVSLLTDGCDQLDNEDSKEARRSAPKTPLGSMSYVSRQEDSSPPSVNGVSQTPECHSPTGNLEMTSLWDVEKTPCNKDQTKSPAAYVRVVPEGEEEFYCVTGTLLDKTLPESGTPYVTNLPSPSPNNGENVDPKPEADFYCVTGTFHDSTSPRLTGQQASPVPNVPYVTNIPSPPCSGHSVGSEPDSKEHFGYQARHSLESPCEEKEVLASNQEGGEGCCHGDQGRHPDNNELQSLKLNLDGYVQRSLPDGTSVTKMPDNVSPTFAPYTPH